MSKTVFALGGVDASALGYGRIARFPHFDAGYAAHFLATGLTDTPETNLFADQPGAAGDGTLVGTPSETGLLASDVAYFDIAGLPRDIFNINSEVTLAVVAKSPANQGLLSDYATSSPSMSLLAPNSPSGGGAQAYSRDDAAHSASAVSNGPGNDNATNWSLFLGEFTMTSSQARHFRTASGWISSSAVTKTSGSIGKNDGTLLRFGRSFSAVTPACTGIILAVYTKILSSDERDELADICVSNMADIGLTL